MSVIWKFTLAGEIVPVEIPVGFKPLHFAYQVDKLCLWAEVDPDAPRGHFLFSVVPTGGEVPVAGTYTGTYFVGPLVWHVYYSACDPEGG